jgi:hypothetical protein
MTLHTQIIEKEGKKFVMLPADEFAILKDTLEDYEDLKALREEKSASGIRSDSLFGLYHQRSRTRLVQPTLLRQRLRRVADYRRSTGRYCLFAASK